MNTIGVKQLGDNLSRNLKRVENGKVVRVLRHGKDVVEFRPMNRSKEQESSNRLKAKRLLGNGTGKTGHIKSVKSLKPEMPVCDLVIEDRR